MKLPIALLCLFTTTAPAVTTNRVVHASWEASPETNVTWYVVAYGNSHTYTITNLVFGRLNTNWTLHTSNMPPGVSYFVVQAFSGATNRSKFSVEVPWTNKPPILLEPPLSEPSPALLTVYFSAASTIDGPRTNLASFTLPVLLADRQRFYFTRLELAETP